MELSCARGTQMYYRYLGFNVFLRIYLNKAKSCSH